MESSRLRRWLENGADPNTCDKEGNSRLHRAVIDDQPESVSLLRTFEADPSIENKEGVSPLLLAHLLGRIHCLEAFGCSSSKFEEMPFTYGEFLTFPDYSSFQYIRDLVGNTIPEEQARLGKEWGAKFRQEIEQGCTAPLNVEQVSEEVGHGLFAAQPLAKGGFVGQYCGRISHQSENPNSNYHLNYPLPGQSFVIDAEPCGGYLRFANHSPSPNMEPRLAIHNSLIHVLFFTTRAVRASEQLLYDYGEGYWQHKSAPLSL